MAYSQLPENYIEAFSIDLQKDKRLMLRVNIIAIVIAAVLIVPMLFLVPIGALFDMEQGFGAYALRFAVLIVGMILYLVLHELVHGAAMKLCGTKKVKYGFTGAYAYAGSEDYYTKRAYIFIALAPIVFWGAVLAVITPLVSEQWFWVVYLIQVSNLSGAAGDIYVTARFSSLSKDILIKDSGVSMCIYSSDSAK